MNNMSALDLVRLVRSKAVSPVEILKAHLDAIARANPAINAICTLAAEQAMKAARSAEDAVMQGRALGPLHGVPVGIKDVTPTAGIRTTYGSPLYAEHVPEEDAEVVSRLKAAGAIIVGKTNTPEFATGANTVNKVFGATRNPWDLRLTAGGSTGGGAAAVAARMLPLAEGTDLGCSLRVPAAAAVSAVRNGAVGRYIVVPMLGTTLGDRRTSDQQTFRHRSEHRTPSHVRAG